jgi:hypothetical protein
MVATVTISESNGAGETKTNDPTNVNMGSNDSFNIVTATYPITAGLNSFEKWHQIYASAMGGSTNVQNIRVWASATLGTGVTHKTNARTAGYEGAQTYAAPSATDRNATYKYSQTMPVAEPGTANLGIAGTLAGTITVAGYSDYLVSQLQTTVSATAGASVTMSFKYDEIS